MHFGSKSVLVALIALAVPALAHPGPVRKTGRTTRPASWSATTVEAAATPVNRAALKDGHMATVTGEIIDMSCFVQLGKRGEGHVACGTKCITSGEPIGLVDAKGVAYVLFAEQHHPRRDGMADIRAMYLPLLSKTVTVHGILSQRGGTKALFVTVPVDSLSATR